MGSNSLTIHCCCTAARCTKLRDKYLIWLIFIHQAQKMNLASQNALANGNWSVGYIVKIFCYTFDTFCIFVIDTTQLLFSHVTMKKFSSIGTLTVHNFGFVHTSVIPLYFGTHIYVSFLSIKDQSSFVHTPGMT